MRIKIKPGTFPNAVKKANKIIPSLNQKAKIFLERLAEIGIRQASINFTFAKYDGHNDVVVDASPEWLNDTTLAIVARGQAVAFIEFGTGILNPEKHPKADELGMIRGAYGQGKGQNKSWGYYGDGSETTAGGKVKINRKGMSVVITRGNNPNYVMYDAAKEMRNSINQIAQEVFNRGN